MRPFGYYRAFTNIALIKYWGKRNETLFLPNTSSLSLTLDAFYTDTKVTPATLQSQDIFYLNHQLQTSKETEKLSKFVDLFRKLAQSDEKIQIESVNHVPTAAGLASSASGYAALACALNQYYQLSLSQTELSILARQGSGSACRSLFGGFVLWHKGKGDDSLSSYSESIDSADWDVAMLVIVLNQKNKKISSRQAMAHTVKTSPFYAVWPQQVDHDLQQIIPAIQTRDFSTVGSITEHNAMSMHATMIASNPSFTYWTPESLIAIEAVKTLREDLGFDCYITMDAGPNVKVLTRQSQVIALKKQLLSYFSEEQMIIASPGSQPIPLKEEQTHVFN